MERGVASGELEPTDVRYLPRIAVAPNVMVAVRKHSFGALIPAPPADAAFLDTHLAGFLRGLASTPPR
jgi:hypothetical protein